MKKLFLYCVILLVPVACQNRSGKTKLPEGDSAKPSKSVIKPPTIFSDTLKIDSKAAVFYYPDSLQLEKIKAGLDTAIFNAVMHEYFYQFRYAHIVLKKYWPGIRILEARNKKYLLFIKIDNSTKIIDLDSKYDPYGLFVFDPGKNPTQLELTNAESEIGFYFAEK